MRFCQLKAGDVLIRNDRPTGVVVECNHHNNVFRWLTLLGDKPGRVVKPDFERADMWNERVFDNYDAVLRGSEALTS